jgi:NAD(P)H-dependent FMN reductase
MNQDGRPLIGLLVGSTRTKRFADLPVEWLSHRLDERNDLEWELVDLREFVLPAYDEPTPPALARRVYGSAEIARLGAAIDRLDGLMIVTPEFNHGYPAALKNALDLLFAEFNRKPVAFVGYGNVGGARAIEQLRLVTVELEMAPLRHAVHILPTQMRAAREGDVEVALADLRPRLDLALDDLVWWAKTLAAARDAESVR